MLVTQTTMKLLGRKIILNMIDNVTKRRTNPRLFADWKYDLKWLLQFDSSFDGWVAIAGINPTFARRILISGFLEEIKEAGLEHKIPPNFKPIEMAPIKDIVELMSEAA